MTYYYNATKQEAETTDAHRYTRMAYTKNLAALTMIDRVCHRRLVLSDSIVCIICVHLCLSVVAASYFLAL